MRSSDETAACQTVYVMLQMRGYEVPPELVVQIVRTVRDELGMAVRRPKK